MYGISQTSWTQIPFCKSLLLLKDPKQKSLEKLIRRFNCVVFKTKLSRIHIEQLALNRFMYKFKLDSIYFENTDNS